MSTVLLRHNHFQEWNPEQTSASSFFMASQEEFEDGWFAEQNTYPSSIRDMRTEGCPIMLLVAVKEGFTVTKRTDAFGQFANIPIWDID